MRAGTAAGAKRPAGVTCQTPVPPAPGRSSRFVYDSPMPLGRLVRQVADKAQLGTQRSWKRPYGVGLIVAGHDESGEPRRASGSLQGARV